MVSMSDFSALDAAFKECGIECAVYHHAELLSTSWQFFGDRIGPPKASRFWWLFLFAILLSSLVLVFFLVLVFGTSTMEHVRE
jgi:hypothetical protein